jgi:hypothetical protein
VAKGAWAESEWASGAEGRGRKGGGGREGAEGKRWKRRGGREEVEGKGWKGRVEGRGGTLVC